MIAQVVPLLDVPVRLEVGHTRFAHDLLDFRFVGTAVHATLLVLLFQCLYINVCMQQRQALLHLLTPLFFLAEQLVIAGVVPEVAVAVVKVTLFALLLVGFTHGVDDLVREGLPLLACQFVCLCVHTCILVDRSFQCNHCYISLHLGFLATTSSGH